jgi:hypothetical protein
VIEQLTLAGVETLCCKHCGRLPDGRCRWLTDTGMEAHIAACFECRRTA